MKGSEKLTLKRERREERNGFNANRKERRDKKKNVNSLKKEGKSGSWRRRKEKRQRSKPDSRQERMMKMRMMAMKRIKLKRQRMVMIKELIEVATEVEDDLIKDKRWSIRKKERPHSQMERLLSSKVEQRL